MNPNLEQCDLCKLTHASGPELMFIFNFIGNIDIAFLLPGVTLGWKLYKRAAVCALMNAGAMRKC